MRNSLIQILGRFAVVDGGPMLQDEAESAADAVLGGLRCDRCRHFRPMDNSRLGDCTNPASFAYRDALSEGEFCSHWEQR